GDLSALVAARALSAPDAAAPLAQSLRYVGRRRRADRARQGANPCGYLGDGNRWWQWGFCHRPQCVVSRYIRARSSLQPARELRLSYLNTHNRPIRFWRSILLFQRYLDSLGETIFESAAATRGYLPFLKKIPPPPL